MPREGVLLSSFVVLALLFAFTGFVTRMFHSKQSALGEEWFNRGSADLEAGKAASALEDFRTALIYSPQNDLFQLRLAQASLAAGHAGEARSYLLNLWARHPGDGQVNLALGRLAAHEGSVEEAVRYYHNAIYGEWPEAPTERPRMVRIELCEYLLAQKAIRAAQAELAALAASIPPADAELHSQVGNYFLEAQDARAAFEEFRRALAVNRHLSAALVGAGTAAVQLGDYTQAEHYLDRAVREDPHDTKAAHLLETAKMVVGLDPFAVWLPEAERRRRTVRDFEQALTRLDACAHLHGGSVDGSPSMTELQKIYIEAQQKRHEINDRNMNRHPELIQPTMDLVFTIEQLAAQDCGQPTGADLALYLLAAKYQNGKK